MRIFVSYTSEQRDLVEPIVHSLRNRGYAVFFDRDDLPPGDSYDHQIEKAIQRSDLLLFMITPESVSAGRFTLTELKHAAQKWRRASGSVLPVMLAETDLAAVPAYLRAVTILEPMGNAPAEITSAVGRIASSRRRRAGGWAAALVLVIAVVASIVWVRREIPEPPSDAAVITKPGFALPRLGGSVPQLVERYDKGFLLGVRGPNELLRLSSLGDVIVDVPIQGVPTDISIGPLGWFLATTAPNEILRLDPKTLQIVRRLSIEFPEGLSGAFDEQPSRTPVSLAQDGENVWLITRDGENGAVLSYTSPDLDTLVVPEYFEKISFDLRDQHLQPGRDRVWAAQTNTTPASVYQYRTDSWSVYGGHDFGALSCASDVAPFRSFLVVPDCNHRLQVVFPDAVGIDVRQDLGALPALQTGAMTWEEFKLVDSGSTLVVAVNIGSVPPTADAQRFVIAEVFANEAARVILERERGLVFDIAGDDKTVLVIVQWASGVRELLILAM